MRSSTTACTTSPPKKARPGSCPRMTPATPSDTPGRPSELCWQCEWTHRLSPISNPHFSVCFCRLVGSLLLAGARISLLPSHHKAPLVSRAPARCALSNLRQGMKAAYEAAELRQFSPSRPLLAAAGLPVLYMCPRNMSSCSLPPPASCSQRTDVQLHTCLLQAAGTANL